VNPDNGREFTSDAELSMFLDVLRSRESFFFELRCESGYTINVGIGEGLSAVQFCLSNGDPPYLVAVAPEISERLPDGDKSPYLAAAKSDELAGLKGPSFLCGGTVTPVPTRYCVTSDVMKQIAVYFLETGNRFPDILWEEI